MTVQEYRKIQEGLTKLQGDLQGCNAYGQREKELVGGRLQAVIVVEKMSGAASIGAGGAGSRAGGAGAAPGGLGERTAGAACARAAKPIHGQHTT